MKYVKMIVIPITMACLALFFYWVLAAFGVVGVVLAGIIFPPLFFLLFWFDFMDIKSQVDGLIAGLFLAVFAVLGTTLCVLFLNWPWVVICNQPLPNADLGILTPVFKLYAAVFNWYGITSFVVGTAITGFMISWLNKRTKA